MSVKEKKNVRDGRLPCFVLQAENRLNRIIHSSRERLMLDLAFQFLLR